jgi:hypothetical protein
MGRLLKISKLTTGIEVVISAIAIAIVLTGISYFAPGMSVAISKQLTFNSINSDNINNVTKGAELPLPSESTSSKFLVKVLYIVQNMLGMVIQV